MLSIRPAGTPPPERGECGADRAEWQERIEHILREGSPFLSDKLDDALDTLQEHTLADIHALMESLEISSARRLVFTLDREGRLDAGEHPRVKPFVPCSVFIRKSPGISVPWQPWLWQKGHGRTSPGR